MNHFHNCRLEDSEMKYKGRQTKVFRASCKNNSCTWSGTFTSKEARHKGIREHRKRALRAERYQAFMNSFLGDVNRAQEALRSFADAATHEYDEWIDIVNGMIRSEAGVDLVEGDIDPLLLREAYDTGRDAQDAVRFILGREYEVVK